MEYQKFIQELYDKINKANNKETLKVYGGTRSCGGKGFNMFKVDMPERDEAKQDAYYLKQYEKLLRECNSRLGGSPTLIEVLKDLIKERDELKNKLDFLEYELEEYKNGEHL